MAYNGKKSFSTLAVHAGQNPKQWKSWAVIPPISLSTTFAQPEPAHPVVSRIQTNQNEIELIKLNFRS